MENTVQITWETFCNNHKSIYLTGRYSLRLYRGLWTGWIDAELSKDGVDAIDNGSKLDDMFNRRLV